MKKGSKHSQKTIQKMKETRRGKNNAFYGKTHTSETKDKLRKAKIGFKHTEETKEKLRQIALNLPRSVYENRKAHSKESRKRQGQTFTKKYTGRNHWNYGKRGSETNQWQGGRINNDIGYILIFSLTHPHRSNKDYVFEHRLVVEKQIGRYLKSGEVCHHINGIRKDNRPENLMAFKSHSIHQLFENGHSISPSDIIFDGRKL